MGDAFSNPDLGPITTEKRLNDVEKLSGPGCFDCLLRMLT